MFRSLLPSLVLGASALLLLSCGGPDPAGSGNNPSVEVSPGDDVLPADHPPLDPSQLPMKSAKVGRLSVAQLRGTFPIAMGKDVQGNDVIWMLYSYPGLEKLADVLGEADYANRTSDNLEISPLYLKLMDIAARDVCDKSLAADFANPDKATRNLLRFVEKTDTVESNLQGVNANLRYLKLRLHGIKIAEEDDASIAMLRDLFAESTKAAGVAVGPQEGWRAVCVGMLTAAEFHLY